MKLKIVDKNKNFVNVLEQSHARCHEKLALKRVDLDWGWVLLNSSSLLARYFASNKNKPLWYHLH